MANDFIELLQKRGDPLERAICADIESLRQVLQPYSEVWFHHVLIRRVGDGSRVEDEWMNFAGSHYSAILRVHHAHEAYKALTELAVAEVPEAEAGTFLLRVHDEWAAFWENIGSAIDNLALAHEDSVPPVVKENAREALMKKLDDIAYAYNRRTQFIHSRIVPAVIRGGVVQFRIRSQERRKPEVEPKESRWDLPYDKELVFFDYIPGEWQKFLNAMEKVWWNLRGELKDRDKGGVKVKAIRFPDLSSDQMFQVVLTGPDGHSLISNTQFNPQKLPPKTITPDLSAIFGSPPPSGNK